MRRFSPSLTGSLAALLALTASASTDNGRSAPETTPPSPVPASCAAGVEGTESLLSRAHYDNHRGAYFAALPEGGEAELTLDRDLQTKFDQILRQSRLETGAIVAMDPRTGRILGMAETSRIGEKAAALNAAYPAASVFKIVTAAALLEAGVTPDREVCFHGGKHRLNESSLRDDPRRDWRCASLSVAMGKSLNPIFGKLAERELDPSRLRSMAQRFFFNEPLPVVPEPPESKALVSPASIPDDHLGFGQAAAGFGKVYLSPLHGAVLASIVGNGGVAASPHVIDSIWKDGARSVPLDNHSERVIPEKIASEIADMMKLTVTEGTARKAFHQGRRHGLGDVRVAGKTGTLDETDPFHSYSWFVGFAPANDPTIAIAVIAQNGRLWTVHAPAIARDALSAYFTERDADGRRASR